MIPLIMTSESDEAGQDVDEGNPEKWYQNNPFMRKQKRGDNSLNE